MDGQRPIIVCPYNFLPMVQDCRLLSALLEWEVISLLSNCSSFSHCKGSYSAGLAIGERLLEWPLVLHISYQFMLQD
jgi:hypothetical protein